MNSKKWNGFTLFQLLTKFEHLMKFFGKAILRDKFVLTYNWKIRVDIRAAIPQHVSRFDIIFSQREFRKLLWERNRWNVYNDSMFTAERWTVGGKAPGRVQNSHQPVHLYTRRRSTLGKGRRKTKREEVTVPCKTLSSFYFSL